MRPAGDCCLEPLDFLFQPGMPFGLASVILPVGAGMARMLAQAAAQLGDLAVIGRVPVRDGRAGPPAAV